MNEITLQYTSTRKEVWLWYWQTWRRKLWMIHALFFVVFLAGIISSIFENPPNYGQLVLFIIYAVILFGGFIGFPQLMFKPQLRTFTVSESGIKTKIGRQAADIPWNQIAKIEDTSEEIVLVRRLTGNSFLVPRRAFRDDPDRQNFLSFIKKWQGKNNP